MPPVLPAPETGPINRHKTSSGRRRNYFSSSDQRIERLDIIEEEVEIELRMWLAEPRAAGLRTRRRHLEVPQSVSFLRARCCQRLQPEESGR